MLETNSETTHSEGYLNRFLTFLMKELNGTGDLLAKIANEGLGRTLIRGYDWIAGGLFLTWVVNNRGGKNLLSTLIVVLISMVWSYINYKIAVDISNKAEWVSKLGKRSVVVTILTTILFVSILFDSFIDACLVFMLFDIKEIYAPGMLGYAFSQLGLIGWVIFSGGFVLSTIVELWVQLIDKPGTSTANTIIRPESSKINPVNNLFEEIPNGPVVKSALNLPIKKQRIPAESVDQVIFSINNGILGNELSRGDQSLHGCPIPTSGYVWVYGEGSSIIQVKKDQDKPIAYPKTTPIALTP